MNEPKGVVTKMKKEGKKSKGSNSIFHSKAFTLILVFIALVILFSIWSRLVGNNFFKIETFRNILSSLILSAFLTIGAGCLLIGGHIDLSQAAIGAFGSMVIATAIKSWAMPWFIAIILGLLLCAAFGALNATLVSIFRFPSFIATLGMSYMAKGLMYMFAGMGNANGLTANVSFSDKVLSFIGAGNIGNVIPFGIIVMVVFFLAYGILISRTKFGMRVMLLGGNPVAANLAGIRSRKMTYILFINGAIMGGIAGMFNAGKLGQGSLLALQGNQFTGITAAILGGISFAGGSGGMGGAFIGLLILNTFSIGMGTVKVNPYWVNVFTGVLLIIALTADYLSQMRVKKSVNL